jgi:hypothetical protein
VSAIPGAAASHGLGKDVLDFVGRGGPEVHVHFGEQPLEFRGDFTPPLLRYRGGIESLDANRFLLLQRAAK